MRRIPLLGLALSAFLLAAACGSKNKKVHTVAAPDQPSGPARTATGGPGTATVTPSGPDADSAPSIGAILFEFDSVVLTGTAREQLDRLAGWLEKSKAGVTIEGHADERGTTEYNVALGQRRADAIADYLAHLGIARARLTTISYGEERPAASGDDESAYAQNRRGELRPDR